MRSQTVSVVVYTTFPNKNIAKKIISELVQKKLAACGNFFKINSIYRWKGKVENEPEYGVFIKTKKRLYKKVEAYIQQHHPYDVPEIIAWPIDRGSPQYLEWIAGTTLGARR